MLGGWFTRLAATHTRLSGGASGFRVSAARRSLFTPSPASTAARCRCVILHRSGAGSQHQSYGHRFRQILAGAAGAKRVPALALQRSVQKRGFHALTRPQEWLLRIWRRRPRGAKQKQQQQQQQDAPYPPAETEEYLHPWNRRRSPRYPPSPPSASKRGRSSGADEQFLHPERHTRERGHPRYGEGPRRGDSGQEPPPPPGGPRQPIRFTDFIVPVGIALFLTTLMGSPEDRNRKTITWQEFYAKMLSRGEVSRLVMDRDRNTVHIYLHDGAVIEGYNDTHHGPGPLPHFQMNVSSVHSFERQLEEASEDLGVDLQREITLVYMQETEDPSSFWLLVMMGSVLALVFMYSRRAGGGGGAASRSMFGPSARPGAGPLGRGTGGAGGAGGEEAARKGAAGAAKSKSPLDEALSVGKIKPHVFTPQTAKTKFKDVAGLSEAKGELKEFVAFLTNPEQFQTLGANVPKGAMLVGPPGTGKTLLAKAVAGEAGVPFLAVSGSDFVEMFVGVGPSRVRDLFQQARESAPCIVYIDEIDAVGRARGAANRPGGSHSERESTLNQLLVEMDGFNTTQGCLVLASTNRVDTLDKALLRPGRFDRQITCDLPTIKEREDIFRVHTRQLRLASEAKGWIHRLAALTPGLSGAQIAAVCNEAALHAARYKKDAIDRQDFEKAVERVIAGIERKTRVISGDEKRVVAYHEAGHALVTWFLKTSDPVLKVSIIPRGSSALGYTQHLHGNHYLLTEEQLHDRMVALLGGRAAEEVLFHRITTGARDDLERVTQMAYDQISKYGMSPNVGLLVHQLPRSAEEGKKKFSNALSQRYDAEVGRIVRSAYNAARDLVAQHNDQLRALGDKLLEREVLTFEDIEAVLGPPTSGRSPSETILESESE